MSMVKIMKGMSEGLAGEGQQDCECLLKMEWPKLYTIQPMRRRPWILPDNCNSPLSLNGWWLIL
jgi:hypothetical protein